MWFSRCFIVEEALCEGASTGPIGWRAILTRQRDMHKYSTSHVLSQCERMLKYNKVYHIADHHYPTLPYLNERTVEEKFIKNTIMHHPM